MSLRFLLDTNILSEPVKKAPNAGVLRRMEAHADQVATCSIVLHELWYGFARLPPSRRKRVLEAYLRDVVQATIPVLPYDSESAVWHSQQRGRLERTGHAPRFADGQIAAVAAVHGLTLVTANARRFTPFRGLKVATWSR